MPDEKKWLWDEPQSWHELDRALRDIAILLDFLGEMPEARLLSYFEDTRGRVADAATRATAPPCASYRAFLDRLSEISAAFQTGRVPPSPPPGPDGTPAIGAAGFVYWSRDFLAAVAAPATADSIRLTHDYMVRRTRTRGWRRWLTQSRPRPRPPDYGPIPPHDPDEATRKMLARKLARWVHGFEWLTVGVVILTVVVSIYALSGRLILAREKDAMEAFAKIDAAVQSQEDKIFPSAQLPMKDATTLPVQALCDFVQKRPVPPTTATVLAGPPNLASNLVVPVNEADPASPPQETFYVSALQAHLCAQHAQVLQSLFVVTMHLQSWSSVVTQRLGQGWDVGPRSYTMHVAFPLAPLFGVVPATLQDYSHEKAGDLCKLAAPSIYKEGAGAEECERVLWTLINRSRNVAESVLGSITQYILPVCYGFLGAMAAAFRLLRRKVDAYLLSYTDRARLQQGAILGVLCGGVLGLFASYIGKADAAGGLGVAAIALLAGYNVDGVFQFLDELSDRLFRPASAAKPRA
ncbi:MAG TPA: hypothetical protein VN702_09135 [Acetobacteraceae bacterium]|nr:hypothetical protein [Acetobacteraceae bacterium]